MNIFRVTACPEDFPDLDFRGIYAVTEFKNEFSDPKNIGVDLSHMVIRNIKECKFWNKFGFPNPPKKKGFVTPYCFLLGL